MNRMRARVLFTALLGAMTALALAGCMRVSETPGTTAKPNESNVEDTEMVMTAEYHTLAQEEAKARMDSGDALIILDVRTQEEYDAGHIAGAILLPNEEIGTEMPTQLPDQDAEILVYCRSGNRSAQAAKKLVGMGYTAVYDFGGINSWAYGVVTE